SRAYPFHGERLALAPRRECGPQHQKSMKPETESDNTAGAVAQERLVRPCECRDWCHDGRDMMSLHHPRCQHYTPPPADPRFARVGEAMWKYIAKLGGDFCVEEISEDILPLAQAAGLCCRVEYDP